MIDRLDRLTEAHLGRTFTAATLEVRHRGQAVLVRAWGAVDADPGAPAATSRTLFDLASVTKLFTVTAFLSLVSGGTIGLDTPLAVVVPEFAAGGPCPIDGGQDPHTLQALPPDPALDGRTVDPAAITFRHLLTHTSGLAPWRDLFRAAGPPPPPPGEPDPVARADRWRRGLAAIVGSPFVDEPGRHVHYSDLGLILLGEAVSRLHGVRGGPEGLAEAISDRVIGPLGLASVTSNPVEHGVALQDVAATEFDERWRRRRCRGEVHDENAAGLGGIAGHAGLFATAADVATLGQAWLERDARLGIAPALMRQAVSEQVRDGEVRRGLGWLIKVPVDSSAGDVMSEDTFGHTGFTGTSLYVDPRRRVVVALLTNRVYFGRDIDGVHRYRRAVHDLVAEEWA